MSAAERNRLVRSGSARWTGTLSQGEGRLATGSGVLKEQRYAFATRFQQEHGTNPEELIAAAHAGCYCMGLTYLLGQAGRTPERIDTTAELALQLGTQGPEVTGIRLVVQARVPGLGDAEFQVLAQQAKETCLVSRLLKVPVELAAGLAA